MVPERLIELTRPFLEKVYPSYLELEKTGEGREKIRKVIVALQERMKTVNEIVELSDFFFNDEVKYDQQSVEKHLKEPQAKEILMKLLEKLKAISPFVKENIEPAFRDLAKEMEIKAGKVIHPARVALTGRMDSPPMFDTVEIIGKEDCIKRLELTIKTLS